MARILCTKLRSRAPIIVGRDDPLYEGKQQRFTKNACADGANDARAKRAMARFVCQFMACDVLLFATENCNFVVRSKMESINLTDVDMKAKLGIFIIFPTSTLPSTRLSFMQISWLCGFFGAYACGAFPIFNKIWIGDFPLWEPRWMPDGTKFLPLDEQKWILIETSSLLAFLDHPLGKALRLSTMVIWIYACARGSFHSIAFGNLYSLA